MCDHSGGSGVLHVRGCDVPEYPGEVVDSAVREYDSPCHACPAGAVMTALDAIGTGGEA